MLPETYDPTKAARDVEAREDEDDRLAEVFEFNRYGPVSSDPPAVTARCSAVAPFPPGGSLGTGPDWPEAA